MEKILITGATGNYGYTVIEELLKNGVDKKSIYAMARDEVKAKLLTPFGVNIVFGNYNDYNSMINAFAGIDKLLFVSSGELGNRSEQHRQVVKAAKNAKVDIAVHLDHGLKIDTVQQALDFGFTSVMFDGSRYDLPENIRLTSQVVEMAAKTGATTEAELGVVGGSEDGSENNKIVCTDPEVAESFAKKTGVDALAVAIGNAHGHYAAAPKLRYDVLEEISKRVRIPLVLHGGTGISPADFRRCIEYGVHKINIATANFDALTKEAERYFEQDGSYNYFQLNEAMVQGVYQNIKRHILIFNNQIPLDKIL